MHCGLPSGDQSNFLGKAVLRMVLLWTYPGPLASGPLSMFNAHFSWHTLAVDIIKGTLLETLYLVRVPS